jgi:hypothetical protein
MKKFRWKPASLLAVLLLGGLSANALADRGGMLEGRYHCDSNNSRITVRYGFEGGEPTTARLRYRGLVLHMKVNRESLAAGEKEGLLRFEGRQGYEWVTDYFTRRSFARSDGNMLMKRDRILAKYCKKMDPALK